VIFVVIPGRAKHEPGIHSLCSLRADGFRARAKGRAPNDGRKLAAQVLLPAKISFMVNCRPNNTTLSSCIAAIGSQLMYSPIGMI
jgi:hypothetical protein